MAKQPSDIWRMLRDHERLRAIARRGFLALGRHLRSTELADLRVILGYLELGAWLGTPSISADNRSLFAAAASTFDAQRPLYLEFGVYEGASINLWSEVLPQPDARLIGFDSFEGLTADWRPGFEAGTFKVGGPPKIADPRVSFEVGLFDQTLPGFELPDHDQLIINIDCDLYEREQNAGRTAVGLVGVDRGSPRAPLSQFVTQACWFWA
jgi:hypothetical protein